jgi:hypothetical protein
MNFYPEVSATYRVEVSGWDASENFFVEKTGLEWNNKDDKEVLLRVSLREGCVIFLRLIQAFGSANTNAFPIAYQAVKVLPKDTGGRTRVYLEQLRPRETFKEVGVAQDSVGQVA